MAGIRALPVSCNGSLPPVKPACLPACLPKVPPVGPWGRRDHRLQKHSRPGGSKPRLPIYLPVGGVQILGLCDGLLVAVVGKVF